MRTTTIDRPTFAEELVTAIIHVALDKLGRLQEERFELFEADLKRVVEEGAKLYPDHFKNFTPNQVYTDNPTLRDVMSAMSTGCTILRFDLETDRFRVAAHLRGNYGCRVLLPGLTDSERAAVTQLGLRLAELAAKRPQRFT